MGPVLIFDKSTLQSLNPNEAVWLDNFFNTNITPVFFIETLADLEKEMRTGRKAEDIVGSLAYKTPEMSSRPNIHHMTLIAGELSGSSSVDMKYGRPHVSGGVATKLDGETGIVFQQSPEEEAFSRWQSGEFLQLERLTAKAWRKGLSNINLEETYKSFQPLLSVNKPKTLADVKKLVDFYIDNPSQENVFIFGMGLLGIPQHSQARVIARWVNAGKPPIRIFAPYFTHVFSVDLFFYLAISADLIGRGRPSHKIDLAYLYYLPFCMVFTSNDKLHASMAPLFLRPNQSFIVGSELKADLSKLDAHYSALPDEIKKRGVIGFAFYPPTDGSFLVAQLWDKHMASTWRERKVTPGPQLNGPTANEIKEKMRRFKEEGVPVPEHEVHSDDATHLVIERKVHGKKGKWNLFPPEVLNRRKNEDGEWEDISSNT